MPTKNSYTNYEQKYQQGFSLLELIVVVTILAVIAGGVIYSQGNSRSDAELSMAKIEMAALKKALVKFRHDVGGFPEPANPADFSELYEIGSLSEWSADRARGWRGPYISSGAEGYVDIGSGIKANGDGNPTDKSTGSVSVRSVADPFVGLPTLNGSYAPCAESEPDVDCILDWRTQPGDARHVQWGRPYLLVDTDDPKRARLISMGPNRKYESAVLPITTSPATNCDEFIAGGDDIFVCLMR